MEPGIRKRGSKYRVEVYVGRDDTGRKRYLSETVDSLDAARAARVKLLRNAGRGMVCLDGTTITELVQNWLVLKEDDLSPNTHEDYGRYAARYIYPTIGDRLVRKVTTNDLDALYRQLRGTLSASSIQRVHVLLRGALKQAVKWGWLTENPALHATPPRLQKPEIHVPEQAVVEKIMVLAEEEDPAFATFVRVAAVMGTRRGEVLALRRGDVGDGQVTVRRKLIVTCERGVEEVAGTKRGQGRVLSMDPGTEEMLAGHFARQDLRWERIPTDPFVFSEDGNKPWHPNVVSRSFARLRDRVDGGERVRLHDLRHYMATTLLMAGFPVHVVSERLGHSSPKTTFDVYSHFIPGADRDAADHIGKLFP